MADITLEQLQAAVPAGEELKAYIDALPALPAAVSMAEFMAKMLRAAYVAANAANAGQPAGSLIAAYPAPTAGGVTTDPNTGLMSYLSTHSVVVRVPANFDGAVGTSA